MDFLKNTKIKDVMASPAITVNERDDFSKVHDKFELYGIRHLPVVDDYEKLVGLISQRQLFRIHSPRRLEDGTWYYDKELLNGFILKNVMFKDVFSLNEEEPLQTAVEYMVSHKFGCIPIVDEKKHVKGVITRDDILRLLLTK